MYFFLVKNQRKTVDLHRQTEKTGLNASQSTPSQANHEKKHKYTNDVMIITKLINYAIEAVDGIEPPRMSVPAFTACQYV